MIKISINNEPKTLNDTSLAQALAQWQPSSTGAPFAVALNGDFVPRSQYGQVLLKDGDQLDIVSPVGGG